MKKIAGLFLAYAIALTSSASLKAQNVEKTLITTEEAKNMYSSINMQRTSVHDPSIVYDETTKRYYVFGSHIAVARTSDLQNWNWVNTPWCTVNSSGSVVNVSSDNAFKTNHTKQVTINGESVTFGNFDAAGWNCALPGTDDNGNEFAWSVNGNMWAPDIIYNPTMEKWCQYLSLNGPAWNSCIILLTADNIEGPYVYQGPVIYTGFRNDTDERISYHKTDLELVIGEQSALPSRYNHSNWGDYWPHAIDPCVFFDEDGKLWMAYGSWSGGIYMLELDETNGLRDYNVTYPSDFDTKQAQVTSDPYFGKKIAGGCYASGEGPYIEHIGDYYYLFMSYGGYAPDGGYEMRVFRSATPDGPYKDISGTDAIFSYWALNYGVSADKRGEKLMGAYNGWGFMTVGECAQGHNSVLSAADGNTYLVYHTKFNDGTVGHQVRVHQLFINNAGWPVAAPFEYNGEMIGDNDIATKRLFTDDEITGTYKVIIHKYSMDHNNYEEVTPVEITLNADGTVNGAYSGYWAVNANDSYIKLTVGGSNYNGVLIEQQMEPTTIKALCFTACNNSGVNIWGYKMRDNYAIAYTLNAYEFPVTEGQTVNKHLDLYGMEKECSVIAEWNSSHPDIISNTGRYNPKGITEDTPVKLTATLSSGNFYWTENYSVTARKETTVIGDWLSGIVAYYGFDDSESLINAYNTEQTARFVSQNGNKKPTLEKDSTRTGNVVHQYFGANGSCSYTRMTNPLKGLELEGTTISMWVKRNDNVAWDAIWAFYGSNKRLFLTGNSYIGFNDGTNWFDYNHPNTIESDNILVGKWTLVTITVSRENGCTLYINGTKIREYEFTGTCTGASIANPTEFDNNLIIDFLQSCTSFYLGYGSFWGSTDVFIDDILIYNRALSTSEVKALSTMSNRVTDFTIGEGGTDIKQVETDRPIKTDKVYDLSGKAVEKLRQGNVYIHDGKKFIAR